MATSRRRAALDNLVTTLQTITVANGYVTNVATVSRRAFEWESVHPDHDLPAIGVVPLDTTFDYIHPTRIVAVQNVALEFAIAASTQVEAWDGLDGLIDDIMGAVNADPTRGGNAMHTRLKSCETDAGNPDIMDSRGGTAAGIIRLEIVLNRPWGITT